MQILDDDHDGSLARQVGQQSGEGRMKPIAIGSSHHRVARSDREGVHAVRGAGDVHERTERPARIDLCTFAHKNPGADRACPYHKLSQQGRLPDTGLAGHERTLAPAADALAQEDVESAHLGVAPDEDGAKDPPIRPRPSRHRRQDDARLGSPPACQDAIWLLERNPSLPKIRST